MQSKALHQHTHSPNHFVAQVEHACAERGLRLTPIRRLVLELVAGEEKPIKAYDLLDQLRAEHNGAAPPTVYRALDFLLENGFIHKLESINAFVGCHHPTVAHTVPFLICDVCARATEICDDQVSRLLNDQALALGFAPAAKNLEVHGVCAQCQKSAKHEKHHA